VVAGSQVSKEAADVRNTWLSQGRSVTNHDLLWHFGGNIDDVWPDTRERAHRFYTLFGLYLATLFLLASAVVTVVQASYCATKRRGRAANP
jgi:hypothetical protein